MPTPAAGRALRLILTAWRGAPGVAGTFQDRHSLSLAEAAGSLAGWLPELSLQFHRHMDDRLRLVQEGVYLTCDCVGLDACGIPGAASGNSIELVDVQLADFSGVHGVLPQFIARQFGCPVSDSKDVRSLRVWKMA